MGGVDDIEDMVSSLSDALRAMLTRAFENGREVGKHEATGHLKAKLAEIRNLTDHVLASGLDAAIAEPRVPAVSSAMSNDTSDSERAAPGSIKPAILNFLAKNERGASASDIAGATGIKENTVRGTLRNLKLEGKAQKIGNVWLKTGQGPWTLVSTG